MTVTQTPCVQTQLALSLARARLDTREVAKTVPVIIL